MNMAFISSRESSFMKYILTQKKKNKKTTTTKNYTNV